MREYLEHVAEATLEITKGAFYDQWSFLWEGELVRATVGNTHYQITILTDHLDSSLIEIKGFIQNLVGKINYEQSGADDYESWD
jgi:hypothetical protein